jgi:methionyl-tRNA formyltransferase
MNIAYSHKKIVMCGCHIAGKKIVESLIDEGIKFSYFVCLSKKQAMDCGVSGYYDYAELAEKNGVPVYYPIKYTLDTEQDIDFFQEKQFDLLIQGGWQRLFPESVLKTLSIGAVGGHGSSDFLPKGRGRSPLNWSLIEGKKRFINQLFLITPYTDDGDVFDYMDFDILDTDDINTLYMKISLTTSKMLIRSLPELISGELQFEKQVGVPSFYKKRTPDDAQIDWENMDVFQIDRMIRAVTKPYPGARAIINNAPIIIWKARIFDTRILYKNFTYGGVVQTFNEDFVVQCRGGLLLVEEFEAIVT